jgi:hypothetical protein
MLTNLAIKEIQIKTTLPVKIATIKNTNYKCQLGCGEKEPSNTAGRHVN